MTTIRIGPKTQILAVLGIAGILAAAVASQAPEIQRYLKIEAM